MLNGRARRIASKSNPVILTTMTDSLLLALFTPLILYISYIYLMQLHNTFSLLIKINFQLPSLTQLIAYNIPTPPPPPPPRGGEKGQFNHLFALLCSIETVRLDFSLFKIHYHCRVPVLCSLAGLVFLEPRAISMPSRKSRILSAAHLG